MSKPHKIFEKTLKTFILGWPLLFTSGAFAPIFAGDEPHEGLKQTVNSGVSIPSDQILPVNQEYEEFSESLSSRNQSDVDTLTVDSKALEQLSTGTENADFYNSLLTPFFNNPIPDRVLNWATYAILIQKTPLNDVILECLAEKFLATENNNFILEGILLFNRISKEKGFSALGHAYLGTFCFTLGFYKDSAESFDEAVRLNPDFNPNFFLDAGDSHWQIGNHKEALGYFEKALHLNPAYSAAVYFSAAQAAMALKQWKKVIELYQTGLNHFDTETDTESLITACYNLGTAHFRLNNWIEVCPAFETAKELGGRASKQVCELAGYAKARLWLASDKQDQNAWEQTLTYLEQALKGRWTEVINENEQAFEAPLLTLFQEAPEIKISLNPF